MPNAINEVYRNHRWLISSLAGEIEPTIFVYAKSIDLPPVTMQGVGGVFTIHFYDMAFNRDSDIMSKLIDMMKCRGLTQIERQVGEYKEAEEGIGGREVSDYSGWTFENSRIIAVNGSGLDYTSVDMGIIGVQVSFDSMSYHPRIQTMANWGDKP